MTNDERKAKAGNDPCQLYRHFAADGKLLYIGISLSAVNRLSQHSEHAPWFREIARVEIEPHPTREAAMKAEVAAIMAERPLYNKVHRFKDEAKSVREVQAEKARRGLMARTVAFNPLYTVTDAARALDMSVGAVRRLILSGELGAYLMGENTVNHPEGPRLVRTFMVSGWHIIDYLESLEKFEAKSA